MKNISKILCASFILIGNAVLAQLPENITLPASSSSQNSVVVEEALFTIEHPDGVVYIVEPIPPIVDPRGPADLTLIAGDKITLENGFEVLEGAFFCAYLDPSGDNFAKLKDKLDGSYHQVKAGVLRIIIEEDYFVSDLPVTLNISDEAGTVLYNNSAVTKDAGVNGIEIDLRSVGGFSDDNFYVVEVTNEKGNSKLLRIKYQPTIN